MEQNQQVDQETEPVVFFDEEKRYDEEVLPLIKELEKKCDELKMPFLIRVICKTENDGATGCLIVHGNGMKNNPAVQEIMLCGSAINGYISIATMMATLMR